jgi:hypothetical protein
METVGRGCKLVQPLCKAVYRFLKKLKIELLHDPMKPLGIYPKECKLGHNTETYTPMFITAQIIIANLWK